MKTQIIQVEAHDDVISLRDKLSWVKARRVLLVYPRRGAAIDSRLAWLLLRRKAEAMGASLGLVAHSEGARRLAQEAGIPVFTSVLEAQQVEWPVTPYRRARRRSATLDLNVLRSELHRREGKQPFSAGARLVMFSLAVLALLTLLLFLLPAAEIRLSPVWIAQSLPFSARAVPVEEQESASGKLLLRTASVVVDGSKVWPASGQIPLAVSYARGSVRFRNLTDTVIGIPAGTVVQTMDSSPVRFITLQDAVVEAGVDRWVDVPVRAELPGTSGNLPADSLTVIEGPLGARLAVTNPTPMYGGSERLVRAPSEVDRQRARTALLIALRHQALTLLREQIDADDVLIPDTLAIAEVLEESSLPAEGQAADVLLFNLKVRFSVHYLSGADLQSQAQMALDAILPAGFAPVEGTFSIQPVESTLAEDGTLNCRFLLRRSIARQVNGVYLARLLRGKRVAVASSLLASLFPWTNAPQIQVKPPWWPWLPFTEFRINIVR